MLLIGERGTGKALLARALATQTGTPYVDIDTPRMVIDVVHHGGKVGELIKGWSAVLEELPPLTLYFDELEFSQAREIGARSDLPVGPIMDFLLEMLDRAIAAGQHLVVGATAHPARIRHAFAQPGRLDRVVEVIAAYPDDVVAALRIHARKADARAGRPLFEEDVDWQKIVGQSKEAPIGDWVRVLHGVLRRKARAEASQEAPPLVTTEDLWHEVERFNQAQRRISSSNGGNYL
jgi:SpoVK/Ycf46/Vps4 family AAA+-type ATPase